MLADRESRSIRVLILSDSYITLSGLQSILESQKDIELLAEESLANITTGVEHVLAQRPDVILFDLDRNSVTDTPDIQQFEKLAQHARIIALFDLRDGEAVKKLMTLGTISVVLKSQPAVALIAAIQSVKASLDAGSRRREAKEMAESIQREGGHRSTSKVTDSLNASEREIIRLVALGFRDEQVADRLHVSHITVRHHLTQIFKKLDVPNRQRLLILARKDHKGTWVA